MSPAFPTPPLSVLDAHFLSCFFTLTYVGSLYISKNARLRFTHKPSYSWNLNGVPRQRELDERWRNDPDVIRARLTAASVATILDCLGVFLLVWNLNGGNKASLWGSLSSARIRLGFTITRNSSETILPSLTAPVLFLGPLLVCFLSGDLPFQSNWTIRRSLLPVVWSWQGWRNYFVGPITEEIVFRACILSVYHLSGATHRKMIFLTPLWFGVAHLHHAWEIYNRYGRTSSALQRAIFSTVFQLGYTTLFGAHCAFLFLRTGSLLPPMISHVFCNIMGLPGFANDVAMFPRRRLLIIITYLAGVVGYIYTMRHWTTAQDSLYWPLYDKISRY
ncbi:hypothetical protein K474DRAFT_1660184 [Panus rudis PR-1116 ss-1]|nr:hypothetical protein K474DRAFT_1660184 [Panus rudis PR-1116 ss-1]